MLTLCCASCSDGGWGETNYRYVEVAPAKFIPVKFSTLLMGGLKIKYEEKIIVYNNHESINRPQSLMEHEGELYLLAFDAKGKRAVDWRWRCFKQEGNSFREIPVSDYPKSIAILNIWWPSDPPHFYSSQYRTGTNGEKIDQLKLSRECDTDELYFRNCEQAWLWFMLDVTNAYSHILYTGDDSGYKSNTSDFVRKFKEKYKPVRLTSMELAPVPKEKRDF